MKLETQIKKWSIPRWKEEAWKYCSIYNRRKHCDWRGYDQCVTCPKRIHWTEGDAGHFQSGRGSGILFYDKGIHLQCKQCNGPGGGGEQYKYGKYIEMAYGAEEVIKQQKMKQKINKYTKQELQRLVEEYKEKISKL